MLRFLFNFGGVDGGRSHQEVFRDPPGSVFRNHSLGDHIQCQRSKQGQLCARQIAQILLRGREKGFNGDAEGERAEQTGQGPWARWLENSDP